VAFAARGQGHDSLSDASSVFCMRAWFGEPALRRLADEADADGAGDGKFVAGGGELSGFLVDCEDDDVVGVPVGGDEVVARGVDAEVAGPDDAFGGTLNESEPTGCRVDREDDDAIVTAVGGVEELAGFMDEDFGGLVGFGEAVRQGADCLDFGEFTGGGVPIEGGDGGSHFVDDVGVLAGGVEAKVARTAARSDFDDAVPLEFGGGGVVTVDGDLVRAEVARNQKTVVGREVHRVSVRAFLALFVDAGACVLVDGNGLAESAAGIHGHRGDAAAAVVGDGDGAALRVDRDVAGSASSGGDSVDES